MLHEEVVGRIRAILLDGEIPPGARIPERDLCDKLQISRTPLREALKVLAAEGLVTMKLRRGAYVTEVSERDLAEWEDLLSRQDGQWDVVMPAGKVRCDAQAQANGYVQLVQHEGGGKIVLVPAPAQFDGEAPQLGKAPAFGADTDDVLRSHGLDDDAIADLRVRGVIA